MNLVTVATFSSSFDMHVIKGRLEADGLTCYVKDEQTISVDPLLDIPVGGIKLQVAESDADIAKELLKDTSYNYSSSFTGASLSSKWFKRKSPFRIVLLILFIVLILLYLFSSPLQSTF